MVDASYLFHQKQLVVNVVFVAVAAGMHMLSCQSTTSLQPFGKAVDPVCGSELHTFHRTSFTAVLLPFQSERLYAIAVALQHSLQVHQGCIMQAKQELLSSCMSRMPFYRINFCLQARWHDSKPWRLTLPGPSCTTFAEACDRHVSHYCEVEMGFES